MDVQLSSAAFALLVTLLMLNSALRQCSAAAAALVAFKAPQHASAEIKVDPSRKPAVGASVRIANHIGTIEQYDKSAQLYNIRMPGGESKWFGEHEFGFEHTLLGAKVGDAIPNVNLDEDTPANKVNIAEFCAGRKVVIVGVVGAFTPG